MRRRNLDVVVSIVGVFRLPLNGLLIGMPVSSAAAGDRVEQLKHATNLKDGVLGTQLPVKPLDKNP